MAGHTNLGFEPTEIETVISKATDLKTLSKNLDSRPDLEQSACLHANMDLYKWSSKLWPWTGSELIGECFELAFMGRDLDMRASPYDLSAMGYEPVRIETPEGRAQYEQEQRGLAARARDLRERLRISCESLSNMRQGPAPFFAEAQGENHTINMQSP